MNTKQLKELAYFSKAFGLWEYPNKQFVWAAVEKSWQLDQQRNQDSYANIEKS